MTLRSLNSIGNLRPTRRAPTCRPAWTWVCVWQTRHAVSAPGRLQLHHPHVGRRRQRGRHKSVRHSGVGIRPRRRQSAAADNHRRRNRKLQRLSPGAARPARQRLVPLPQHRRPGARHLQPRELAGSVHTVRRPDPRPGDLGSRTSSTRGASWATRTGSRRTRPSRKTARSSPRCTPAPRPRCCTSWCCETTRGYPMARRSTSAASSCAGSCPTPSSPAASART